MNPPAMPACQRVDTFVDKMNPHFGWYGPTGIFAGGISTSLRPRCLDLGDVLVFWDTPEQTARTLDSLFTTRRT